MSFTFTRSDGATIHTHHCVFIYERHQIPFDIGGGYGRNHKWHLQA